MVDFNKIGDVLKISNKDAESVKNTKKEEDSASLFVKEGNSYKLLKNSNSLFDNVNGDFTVDDLVYKPGDEKDWFVDDLVYTPGDEKDWFVDDLVYKVGDMDELLDMLSDKYPELDIKKPDDKDYGNIKPNGKNNIFSSDKDSVDTSKTYDKDGNLIAFKKTERKNGYTIETEETGKNLEHPQIGDTKRITNRIYNPDGSYCESYQTAIYTQFGWSEPTVYMEPVAFDADGNRVTDPSKAQEIVNNAMRGTSLSTLEEMLPQDGEDTENYQQEL